MPYRRGHPPSGSPSPDWREEQHAKETEKRKTEKDKVQASLAVLRANRTKKGYTDSSKVEMPANMEGRIDENNMFVNEKKPTWHWVGEEDDDFVAPIAPPPPQRKGLQASMPPITRKRQADVDEEKVEKKMKIGIQTAIKTNPATYPAPTKPTTGNASSSGSPDPAAAASKDPRITMSDSDTSEDTTSKKKCKAYVDTEQNQLRGPTRRRRATPARSVSLETKEQRRLRLKKDTEERKRKAARIKRQTKTDRAEAAGSEESEASESFVDSEAGSVARSDVGHLSEDSRNPPRHRALGLLDENATPHAHPQSHSFRDRDDYTTARRHHALPARPEFSSRSGPGDHSGGERAAGPTYDHFTGGYIDPDDPSRNQKVKMETRCAADFY